MNSFYNCFNNQKLLFFLIYFKNSRINLKIWMRKYIYFLVILKAINNGDALVMALYISSSTFNFSFSFYFFCSLSFPRLFWYLPSLLPPDPASPSLHTQLCTFLFHPSILIHAAHRFLTVWPPAGMCLTSSIHTFKELWLLYPSSY